MIGFIHTVKEKYVWKVLYVVMLICNGEIHMRYIGSMHMGLNEDKVILIKTYNYFKNSIAI